MEAETASMTFAFAFASVAAAADLVDVDVVNIVKAASKKVLNSSVLLQLPFVVVAAVAFASTFTFVAFDAYTACTVVVVGVVAAGVVFVTFEHIVTVAAVVLLE